MGDKSFYWFRPKSYGFILTPMCMEIYLPPNRPVLSCFQEEVGWNAGGDGRDGNIEN